MNWLRLFGRSRSKQEDLDEELRTHFEIEVQQRMERGATREQAEAEAQQAFGNTTLVKEVTREMWGWRWLERVWMDVRYAVRQLRKSPGFTLTAALTLALGIGANTAIFSLLNAVLLRSLPVVKPEQLVLFQEGLKSGRRGTQEPAPGAVDLYSHPLYQRLRAQTQIFDGVAAQQSDQTDSVVQVGGSSGNDAGDYAAGRCATANYFDVLGVPAYRGRTFGSEDETAPGANPVIVLSHGYWQRRFGESEAILGAQLLVNGTLYTVIGITPPGFTGAKVGSATDFWVPITMQTAFMRYESFLSQRNVWWLQVIGRLKPGVSLPQAQANMNVTLQQYLAEAPASSAQVEMDRRGVRIQLLSGAKGMSPLRQKFRLSLFVLMGGVGLLLLIACANLSHLLLTRALSRQREISLRLAIGASRAQILRQLFTEGLLLALSGGLLGLLLARWLSQGLLQLVSTGAVPLPVDTSADTRVLAFTAFLTLVTALLFSLIPAWQAARIDLNIALQGATRSIAGGVSRSALSRTLLVSQVALSLLLLMGASLLVGTLRNLQQLDKGFQEEHVLIAELSPRLIGITQEQILPLYDELLQRIRALPNVRSASLSLSTILSGDSRNDGITLPGYTPARGEDMGVQIVITTPDYFQTIGMPLARGRGFTREDRAGSTDVAVVNEAMARRFFGKIDVIGRHFGLGPGPIEIIGVVKNAKIRDLREEPRPVVYFPVTQSPDFLKSLEVRTIGYPEALANEIRRTIASVNPNLPILQITTLHEQVDRSLTQERLMATLASAFGLVALLLVSLGLYGVLSHSVAQRTNEIGIRMALGAKNSQVLWLVLRETFWLASLGIAIGLPIALGLTRFISSMLFGLNFADPTTLGSVIALLVMVSVLAGYLPARRAASVDPMVALRHE